ncbi:RNA polymerase sigma factor [Echinimonas agarilytica]|uniref:Sigma-70 family RNA polymerase sigma factor n=1 Tax=Echinimonas agarilytica TaxID=1215918 RepID=A0AA41W845_9GAMM|nr:sigma-70 family RNA polymerase sigma factor [Echinimonas agarilytica]MCM2680596.1 sigma-70 family RNA polymerase sigma factor [Echinimonas agarilytica]
MSNQGQLIEAHERFTDTELIHLIEASRAGDKAAYRQLYDISVGQVYGLALRLIGDRNMAEDATQEVFIQLWNKLDNYAGDAKFSTWLHRVTANITVSYMRRQKSWWQRTFSIENSEAMQLPAQSDLQQVNFEAHVASLPERARMVFVLHAIEGYRHEDVAEMLNMAVGTSKAQYHRAKHLLKERLGHE